MGTTCYCCDEPAIGQGDHVPPKALFQSNTFATSAPIIVPSCPAHNQAKSSADEYLKFVLTSAADGVPNDVRGGTVRSVIRHAKNPKASLYRFGMERTQQGLTIGKTAPVDSNILDEALGKVARGIYYHHHRGLRKLTGEIVVHPIFLGLVSDTPPEILKTFEDTRKLMDEDMRSSQVHGEYPDVFKYQVFDEFDHVRISMVFYKSKSVLVVKRL